MVESQQELECHRLRKLGCVAPAAVRVVEGFPQALERLCQRVGVQIRRVPARLGRRLLLNG